MTGNLTTTTTAVQITDIETGADLALDAEFHYDPTDPLAVSMVVESITGPVRWTFARELLLNGRFEPTGDGDVHIWPCLNTHGVAVVIVELQSPAGATLLQFSLRAIHQFVSAALATVPEGTEHYDVDACLTQLFTDTDNTATR
jgi:hypothetical protein